MLSNLSVIVAGRRTAHLKTFFFLPDHWIGSVWEITIRCPLPVGIAGADHPLNEWLDMHCFIFSLASFSSERGFLESDSAKQHQCSLSNNRRTAMVVLVNLITQSIRFLIQLRTLSKDIGNPLFRKCKQKIIAWIRNASANLSLTFYRRPDYWE